MPWPQFVLQVLHIVVWPAAIVAGAVIFRLMMKDE